MSILEEHCHAHFKYWSFMHAPSNLNARTNDVFALPSPSFSSSIKYQAVREIWIQILIYSTSVKDRECLHVLRNASVWIEFSRERRLSNRVTKYGAMTLRILINVEFIIHVYYCILLSYTWSCYGLSLSYLAFIKYHMPYTFTTPSLLTKLFRKLNLFFMSSLRLTISGFVLLKISSISPGSLAKSNSCS